MRKPAVLAFCLFFAMVVFCTGKPALSGSPKIIKIVNLKFSPDGKSVTVGDYSGLLCIWDSSSGKKLATLGN